MVLAARYTDSASGDSKNHGHQTRAFTHLQACRDFFGNARLIRASVLAKRSRNRLIRTLCGRQHQHHHPPQLLPGGTTTGFGVASSPFCHRQLAGSQMQFLACRNFFCRFRQHKKHRPYAVFPHSPAEYRCVPPRQFRRPSPAHRMKRHQHPHCDNPVWYRPADSYSPCFSP